MTKSLISTLPWFPWSACSGALRRGMWRALLTLLGDSSPVRAFEFVSHPHEALLPSLIRSSPVAACSLPQLLNQLRSSLGGGGGGCRGLEFLSLRTPSFLGIDVGSTHWVTLRLPPALVVPWGTVLTPFAAPLIISVASCISTNISSLPLTIMSQFLRRPFSLAFAAGSPELAAKLPAARRLFPMVSACLMFMFSTLSIHLAMKLAAVPDKTFVGDFFIPTPFMPMW